MSRRRATGSSSTRTRSTFSIEPNLILFRYILSLLGFSDFRTLKSFIGDKTLDFIADSEFSTGNTISPFAIALCEKLTSTTPPLFSISLTETDILRYDKNILNYVKEINSKRDIPIKLKYFQYLAVLFSEIYFDLLKNKPDEFVLSLNEFAKSQHLPFEYKREDLNKLAYYMATGSGKTLIAHINYYQFLHYQLFNPDHIIFITPSAILSKQHYNELKKSKIPAVIYSESSSYDFLSNTVIVIEITKFTEEKKGSGLSITPDTFEGKNLIFVDEGHKGQRSEDRKWKSYRDQLADQGFVFEYSATFAQILDPTDAPDTFEEYCKSIVFDYSYKYFYLDGYGKDFHVNNISNPNAITENEFIDIMFVANIISFYDQLKTYYSRPDLASKYNLKKPLWIFIGATVSSRSRAELSDVISILQRIKATLENPDWFLMIAEIILNAKTGLKNPYGEDIFENHFSSYVFKKFRTDPTDLYLDILETVFNGRGPLYLFEIKNADGEIALRSGDNPYFGLINIGNISDFKKALTKAGFTLSEDPISSSLFDSITLDDSRINILIGSRKFIEGWDTWRITTIGLLNIGRNPGPQIIQLFGRGVRILGENNSLKRSYNPEVKPLETLYVYGIKANYLIKFLEAIKKEEIEIEQIDIPVKPQYEEKWNELQIIKVNSEKFHQDEIIDLSSITNFKPALINLIPTTELAIKKKANLDVNILNNPQYESYLFDLSPYVDLFNWQRIYSEILTFKQEYAYHNLYFTIKDLKNLLKNGAKPGNHNNAFYKLYLPPALHNLTDYSDLLRFEDIAISVLKQCISNIYKSSLRIYEKEHLDKPTPLSEIDPLSVFRKNDNTFTHTLFVKKDFISEIKKIKEIIDNPEHLFYNNPTDSNLPRIVFDQSLIIPLLIHSSTLQHIESMIPAGLNEGERDFLLGLIDYLKKPTVDLSNHEVFVLRNYPKSGIGFLMKSKDKFYPDFIIWIKPKSSTYPQAIVFADPKSPYFYSEDKAELSTTIKEIESKLNSSGSKIILESFIIFTQKSWTDESKNIESKNIIYLDKLNIIFEKVMPQL